LVWYACYGSNIDKEYFLRYIDENKILDEKPIEINHEMYFANKSSRWDRKGVAFLDTSIEGKTYGKAYLITKDDLKKVHTKEGKSYMWYNSKKTLGSVQGIPIATITRGSRHSKENPPSLKYFEVIKEGIKKSYPNFEERDIEIYLLDKFIKNRDKKILKYLREAPHGVEIMKITNDLGLHHEKILDSIKILKEMKLIKQDGRNARIGVNWDEYNAIYYTRRPKREIIDNL